MRVVLRLAAAVAVGFIGGTIGYFQYMSRMIALRPMVASQSDVDRDGYFDVFIAANGNALTPVRLFGFGDFCLAGIYAVGFGLLTRHTSGRSAGASIAWLAMVCAGLMIAGIAEPTSRAGQWKILAGTIGGLVAGAPVALYVLLSGLAEQRDKKLGRSRFSLKALLWIVLGFALLFGALQLRGEYERRQHSALIRGALKAQTR